MFLAISTMDSVLVDFSADGRVRFRDEDWSRPSVQEIRAIIHAARQEIESLEELIAAVEARGKSGAAQA